MDPVAAPSDFVFIATSASEIQFIDPREPELLKLIHVNPSSSPDTSITALLCRSPSALLFARGTKIYCRTMDSSKVGRVTSNPKGAIHRMTIYKNRSLLATISSSPSNALHAYGFESGEWTGFLLPSTVFPLVSVEFSTKSSDTLENSIHIYDTKKPKGPQRVVSLSTLVCEHMCVVPASSTAAVVAAKGGKILLIDTSPKIG